MNNLKKSILMVSTFQSPQRLLFDKVKYMSGIFDITFISPDDGKYKFEHENINTIYLDIKGAYTTKKNNVLKRKFINFVRYIRLISYVKNHLYSNKYDMINIRSGKYGFLLKLFFKSDGVFVGAVPSPGVSASFIKNFINDMQGRFNVLFFEHILMTTEFGKKFFLIPDRKAHILGLGIDGISYKEKTFDAMHLIYLGVLNNRYVHETVIGFSQFYREHGQKICCSYKIIGTGTPEEVKRLKDSIIAAGSDVPIKYFGRLQDDELAPIFDESNIGVVYNKNVYYFTNNISTKLYEYLLSGMPVISVKANSVQGVVSDINGVQIDDTPEGFKKGLEIMMQNLHKYNSSEIAKSGEHGSAKRIVEDNWIPAFNKILESKR